MVALWLESSSAGLIGFPSPFWQPAVLGKSAPVVAPWLVSSSAGLLGFPVPVFGGHRYIKMLPGAGAPPEFVTRPGGGAASQIPRLARLARLAIYLKKKKLSFN